MQGHPRPHETHFHLFDILQLKNGLFTALTAYMGLCVGIYIFSA